MVYLALFGPSRHNIMDSKDLFKFICWGIFDDHHWRISVAVTNLPDAVIAIIYWFDDR